jgi:SAM-dependent methyltransferase
MDAIRTLPVRDGYDVWAEVYDTDGNPLVALEEEHIGELIGDPAGLDVLDAGCGTGRHAIPLARAGARVTALDFSDRMLAVARAKPGAELVRFAAHDVGGPLPVGDETFDRVLCCLVAEHIADLVSLFRELGRACRRGPGRGIIVSALHPALMLRGVQARFIDPVTGDRTQLVSVPHQISDYVMAALRAGLSIEHASEHVVTEALAARLPRAEKYVGWPMLFLMKLAR